MHPRWAASCATRCARSDPGVARDAVAPVSSGADLEQIATFGLLAMFGSVPLTAPIGWLVGRRVGFEGGASVVLLVFGIAAAGAAVWLAVHVHLQTTVTLGTRVGCAVTADGTARERYALAVGAVARHAVVTVPGAAWCERTLDGPQRLRVQHTSPPDADPPARIEADPRQANALIGVFAAFGGFGLLAGTFFAVTTARRHRAPRAVDERALSPRRQRLGQGFTIAGNLAMVGCALVAAFADLDAVRAGVLVFGGASVGCVSFALAMAARRALGIESTLILAIVGGGTGLAALSPWYLG